MKKIDFWYTFEKNLITIIPCFTIILVLIGYVTTNIYRTNSLKQIEEKKAFNNRLAKTRYEICKTEAFDTYHSNWVSNCKGKGRKDDCLLESSLAEYLGKELTNDEKSCMEIYQLEIK